MGALGGGFGCGERAWGGVRAWAARSVWGWFALRAVVPPNFADLPKHTFRVMVSADFDNLGGHPHHPCHHSPTGPLRRHEHADP